MWRLLHLALGALVTRRVGRAGGLALAPPIARGRGAPGDLEASMGRLRSLWAGLHREHMVEMAEELADHAREVEAKADARDLGGTFRAAGALSSTCARCHAHLRWHEAGGGER